MKYCLLKCWLQLQDLTYVYHVSIVYIIIEITDTNANKLDKHFDTL